MVLVGSLILDVCGVINVPSAWSQSQSQAATPTSEPTGQGVGAESAQSSASNGMGADVTPPPGLPGPEGSVNLADGSQDARPLSYDPTTRRDPFTALIDISKDKDGKKTSLPPLQQVGLTELNIIGVMWGGFGFTAMVQTPDGKGYSVRRGTLVGPNNGVVTSITQKGLVVTERYTDIYGRQKEREHIKLLHNEEEFE